MDAVERLMELVGDIEFKSIDGNCSVDELRENVRHNLDQYAKIEAKGEQFEERVQDQISLVLAEKLNPMVIDKVGDSSESSLHHVVTEFFQTPESIAAWEKTRSTIRESLKADGLDESQIEALSGMLDSVPGLVIDHIVELAGRLKVIPMEEVSNITRILASMMKEENYDDNPTNN